MVVFNLKGSPKRDMSISIFEGYAYMPISGGFIIRGFIWDIPLRLFASVLFFGGPLFTSLPCFWGSRSRG